MVEKLFFVWPQRYGLIAGSHIIGIAIVLFTLLLNNTLESQSGMELGYGLLCALILFQIFMHQVAKATQKRLNRLTIKEVDPS